MPNMVKALRLIFIIIFLFSVYHLFRDLLTNFGVHNYIVDFAHRSHLWCNNFYPWVVNGLPFCLKLLPQSLA